MTDPSERIAILETHRGHQEEFNERQESFNKEVIDQLESIKDSTSKILLNLEGKTGFFRGVLFMVTVIGSVIGGLAAWLIDKYTGH